MAWTDLHAQLHQILRSRRLLPPKSSILIAVSGGQDSLCLTQLLLDLQPKWSWKLAVIHCDHRWRSDSQENALHVQKLAAQWNLPFHLRTATETLSSEAAARDWRYQMLVEVAEQAGYGLIVTGHTQSDRAETLLYNLLRGSGADGLQSLTWQRALTPQIQLIRPLLTVNRRQTEEFCQTFNLPIWEDSTNQDFKYARNRIRGELIPYLQTHFNPQVEAALAQTAELLRADVDYLETTAEQLLQQAWQPLEDTSHPRLSRGTLKTIPLALQRRVMRRFLTQVLPQSPSYEQVEKLVALIASPNRSQTDPFPGGAIAQVSGDWIIWHPQP